MKSLTVKTSLKAITIFYIISRINLTEHDFILISLWYFCFSPFTFYCGISLSCPWVVLGQQKLAGFITYSLGLSSLFRATEAELDLCPWGTTPSLSRTVLSIIGFSRLKKKKKGLSRSNVPEPLAIFKMI